MQRCYLLIWGSSSPDSLLTCRGCYRSRGDSDEKEKSAYSFPCKCSFTHAKSKDLWTVFGKLDFVLSFGILAGDDHQTLHTIKYLFSKNNQKEIQRLLKRISSSILKQESSEKDNALLSLLENASVVSTATKFHQRSPPGLSSAVKLCFLEVPPTPLWCQRLKCHRKKNKSRVEKSPVSLGL